MSILENLLEAIKENTAALKAAGGSAATSTAGKAATTTKAAADKKADKAAAPKHTAEEVKAAAVSIKDAFGQPAAKELIKSAGKAEELKAIKPENYDAFVEACEAKLAAGTDEVASEDDL